MSVAESLASLRGQVMELTGVDAPMDMLTHAMAVVADSQWREGRLPSWMLFVGPPGTWKTDALMAQTGPHVHRIDTAASAASFLSGLIDMKTGTKARSVLSELNNRTLIIKDMTAMLSDDPKKAKAVLGAMTNHFDGEYAKAVGTALQDVSKTATLTAKCRYSLLAAVTPATFTLHQDALMGMGPRTLNYLVPAAEMWEVADFERLKKEDLKARYAALHEATRAHLDRVIALQAPVTFDADVDTFLAAAANMIARGRRAMMWYDTPTDEGRMERDWGLWEAETPARVHQQLTVHLRNLTRLAGLDAPSPHELEMVAHLAVGSCAFSRARLLVEMRRRPAVHPEGGLGTMVSRLGETLEVSETQIRFLLDVLGRSKVITHRVGKEGKVGRPAAFYEPVAEFAPLFWGGKWGLPVRGAEPVEAGK